MTGLHLALGAMVLGGAAGTWLGPRTTFVAAGMLSMTVGLVLLARLRQVVAGTAASTEPATSPARAGAL